MLAAAKPGTDKILARAGRALSAAERALQDGGVDLAAARSYSAMIGAAKALLNEKGLRFAAHAAILAAFEKHAPASGVSQQHIGRLRAALERRERDAREELTISFADAREMVEEAREFVEAVGGMVSR